MHQLFLHVNIFRQNNTAVAKDFIELVNTLTSHLEVIIVLGCSFVCSKLSANSVHFIFSLFLFQMAQKYVLTKYLSLQKIE